MRHEQGRPVATIIGSSLPVTLSLVAVTVAVSCLLGIPLGLLAALGGEAVDFGVRALMTVLLALPPFLPNALRVVPVAAGVSALVGAAVSVVGFGIGGWVASRLCVVHTSRTALLSGALVWAVCLPAMPC